MGVKVKATRYLVALGTAAAALLAGSGVANASTQYISMFDSRNACEAQAAIFNSQPVSGLFQQYYCLMAPTTDPDHAPYILYKRSVFGR